jgi:hypothetical protein
VCANASMTGVSLVALGGSVSFRWREHLHMSSLIRRLVVVFSVLAAKTSKARNWYDLSIAASGLASSIASATMSERE